MSTPTLDRHFALRKLHSLLGLVPIGAFLAFHLFENSMAVKGEAYFTEHVIHKIGNLPYVELLEIFVEEASEIMDSSANTLREWSKEPARRELMDEFQRQLHTLKGGARMVGIEAIGNLSHSVESLLTRVVDGHVDTGTRLFDLLQDAHDRLADMLEQVRDSRMPEPVGELETALDRLGFETDGYDEVVEVVADDGDEAAATAEAMADQEQVPG